MAAGPNVAVTTGPTDDKAVSWQMQALLPVLQANAERLQRGVFHANAVPAGLALVPAAASPPAAALHAQTTGGACDDSGVAAQMGGDGT